MKPMKMTALSALLLCTAAGAGQAEQTLTMWARSSSEAFMPPLVEAFNKTHDVQIDLQIVPSNDMVQKYGIAAAGGSAPDLVALDLVYTTAFALAGQLEDRTDLANSLPYFDQLSKAHVGAATYEGRIYGLPMSADASVLLWNKKLFREAGLDGFYEPTARSRWARTRSCATAAS